MEVNRKETLGSRTLEFSEVVYMLLESSRR